MDSKVEELYFRANTLAAEFEQGCRKNCIDEAIILDREALELCPPGQPRRSVSLTQLAAHLWDRYEQFGEIVDLEEAVVLNRDALVLRPLGHENRSGSLNSLAIDLATRHYRLGKPEDLDEAIVLTRDALALCPPGPSYRSTRLNNLATYLSDRYKLLGAIADLDESIVLAREALELCPPGNSDRSMCLINLASRLSDRYQQLGATVDLNEAIILLRDALKLRPPGDPGRPMCSNNLANRLADRYKLFKEIGDIDEAIVLARDAVEVCLPGKPVRVGRLNNLANCLLNRYQELGVIADLNEAIELARAALELCPPGHPGRPMCLHSLTNDLTSRYERINAIEDINEATVLAREALDLYPHGHLNRTSSLDNLAFCLYTRFTRLGQLEDKEELFNLYSQISHISQTISSADLSTARTWINITERLGHPTTLLAYETYLRLLIHHLAALPSLPQHLDILKKHTSSLAMDAFSACLRNHSPAKAVELLEQGRGVFLSQLSRLRSPLDDVIASGPEGRALSDKFTDLTSLIRNALASPGADQHDRLYRLNIGLERVVADIRKLPGFSHFLLPALFSDLQKAASGGPVIIVNASKYSCDALIVLLDRDPVHVPLQITRARVRDMSSELQVLTKRAKLEDVTRYFVAFLRELWQKVVSPIVDLLQTIHPPQSRIWWCPTAEFSLLPLHAAGSYRTGQQKLTDLYISSYTPTLTALIRARRHESETQGNYFVAIGQAQATGEQELFSVSAELANIGERVKSLATFKTIEGSGSCISHVADELDKNDWVHLACHGLSNRKQPFESAFALHDGHFTVERIMRCELHNAQFAYLSACHTTVGDEECPDEMIHLASAMQFAGFRSVIGTMWAVDDSQTKKITSMFYDNMVDASGRLDHTRAAFALHKTMQTLVGISFDQRILYIHLGA